MLISIFHGLSFLFRILRIFFLNKKNPKFYKNKYFDMYINTFDGYESSTQCTALPKVDIWSNFFKKEKKKSD